MVVFNAALRIGHQLGIFCTWAPMRGEEHPGSCQQGRLLADTQHARHHQRRWWWWDNAQTGCNALTCTAGHQLQLSPAQLTSSLRYARCIVSNAGRLRFDQL